MAAPFRNQPVDLTAPTPQNTPANAAPISSRAQQPNVGSIKEVDELDARALGALAQNPAMVALMQSKLNSLIGRSSGYVESLPAEVRTRITGLKGIQVEHSKLEARLQEEVLELEKKYFKLFTPLYEKRAKIVNGVTEPSEEEIASGKAKEAENAEDDDEEEETEIKAEGTQPADDGKVMVGIPEFWLTSMKTNPSLQEMITDEDEGALRRLTDIRMEYLEKPGFKLIFEFAENDFFSEKILTKTYYYQEENGYGGDFIYDHAEGCTISWKPNKNLTVRIESKKQRNKNTKQTRIIKKTVPQDSFFNFFAPPVPPKDNEEHEEDIEERLELDYQLGEDIKEKIIPHAVSWFTGEALQYEGYEEVDEEEFDEDEDEEDEESEDGDDDEDDSDEEGDESKPKQDTTECKQS